VIQKQTKEMLGIRTSNRYGSDLKLSFRSSFVVDVEWGDLVAGAIPATAGGACLVDVRRAIVAVDHIEALCIVSVQAHQIFGAEVGYLQEVQTQGRT